MHIKHLFKLFILTVFLVSGISIVKADDSDDTLKFYLSKSDLVVLGEIITEPMGIIKELGVPNYICEFEISDVLKGNSELKGQIIKINIMRFEMEEKDRHPLIQKNSELILFLKSTGSDVPSWATVDFWFGVQYPSPWMAKSLKRLNSEK